MYTNAVCQRFFNQRRLTADETSSNINPPVVHSICFGSDGRLYGGLGSGQLMTLQHAKRKKRTTPAVQMQFIEGHAWHLTQL